MLYPPHRIRLLLVARRVLVVISANERDYATYGACEARLLLYVTAQILVTRCGLRDVAFRKARRLYPSALASADNGPICHSLSPPLSPSDLLGFISQRLIPQDETLVAASGLKSSILSAQYVGSTHVAGTAQAQFSSIATAHADINDDQRSCRNLKASGWWISLTVIDAADDAEEAV
jgi:hypothetical protein